MAERSDLDLLVKHGAESATPVALSAGVPSIEATEQVVRRALECLLANRLISVTPRGDWPCGVFLDPPYSFDSAAGGTQNG